MKLITLHLFLAATAVTQAFDNKPWQWMQTFEVSKAGIIRLALPPDVLNASMPRLEDVRILSPSGSETPYALEKFESKPARIVNARNSHFALGDQISTLEVETGITEAIDAISVQCTSNKFLKAVRLEGSNDGAEWHVLAANDVLFQQPRGASRLRIPFPSGVWSRLKLTVDDSKTAPVVLTDPQLEITGTDDKPGTEKAKASIAQTEETSGETRFTVDVGAANLHLASLHLEVTDPVFSRQVRVVYTKEGNDTRMEVPVATALLYRVATGEGAVTESLDIPIQLRIPAAKLIVIVDNGGSPPLHVTGAAAELHPQALLFFAQETGSWRLITGRPRSSAPEYDVQALQQQVTHALPLKLASGLLKANASYQAPPALPDLSPEGAKLDVSAWMYRKALPVQRPGIFNVELDTEARAHAKAGLPDVRILQNGHQMPYLLNRTNVVRSILPGVTPAPDEKRPGVSIWRVTATPAGVPVTTLAFSSPTPLFDRLIKIWRFSKEPLGQPVRVEMGSAQWAHSPASSKADFKLDLRGMRAPEEFYIETDNGDNPPITIENVKLNYEVISLVTKLTDSSPAFIYYGNERASAPNYDLKLVKQELLSAPSLPLSAGAEEILKAQPQKPGTAEGSPWLWAALAVMIGGLLWVVARMLPKSEGAP